jgi:hypothetical protein
MTENIFVLTPLPVKKHRTGIVDADSIMYQVGWKLQAMGVLSHISLDQLFTPPDLVYREVNQYLESLQNDVGVDNLELHFTASNKNRGLYEKFSGKELRPQFRTQLGASYKDNRSKSPTDLPFAYHAILQVILESHLSFMHDLWEADDSVCLLKRLNPDYILISCDKDVYKQSIGAAYQYDKRKTWSITTVENANMFPYVQAITGDPTDGFVGAKGIGIKSIPQFINVNMSAYELWQGVLKAHKSVGNSEDIAIWNMRMASMNQLTKDGQLQLWEPPTPSTEHVYLSSGEWSGLQA